VLTRVYKYYVLCVRDSGFRYPFLFFAFNNVMKRMMNLKTYTTKDFYLCVLLMTKGFKLLGSEKRVNGVHFIVENKNEELLQSLVQKFINFEAYAHMGKMVKCMAQLRNELDKHK
jgi:hypothetical protein